MSDHEHDHDGTPSSRKRRRPQVRGEQARSEGSSKKRRVGAAHPTPTPAAPAAPQPGPFTWSASKGASSVRRRLEASRKALPGKEKAPSHRSGASPWAPEAQARGTARRPSRASSGTGTGTGGDPYDIPVSDDELVDSPARVPASPPAVDSPSQRPKGRARNNTLEAGGPEHDGIRARSARTGARQSAPGEGRRSSGTPIEVVLSRRKSAVSGGRRAEVLFEDLPLTTEKKRQESVGRWDRGSLVARGAHDAEASGKQQVAQSESGDEAEKKDAQEEEDEDEIDEHEHEHEHEHEQDEIVCAVCSEPHTAKGNQILLCDGCDMGVHQKCYGVAVIPRGDWFCRDCSRDGVKTTRPKKSSSGEVGSVAPAEHETETADMANFAHHLRCMQRVLLDRCTGRRRLKLRGEDDAYAKAFQLVEQTVVAGEGNSLLVIGSRGSGKTTLVESIVSDISEQHRGDFHVVRLNGFIHTDDKLALKEIWRQLGKEMDVEDDVISKTSTYADTLASLLALLSHPSEIAEAEAEAEAEPETETGTGTTTGVTSSSVVIILDEFDLFTTHARQTLLYNLFDIAQAKKAPIAVLGLTTRIDVVERLEKRVKSRFSHRHVYLSLAKSLPAYWDMCRQGLSIDDEDMQEEGIDGSVPGHDEFWKWWRHKIDRLRESPAFQHHLAFHFCSSKSVSAFLTTWIQPLAALSPTKLSLEAALTHTGALRLDAPDSKLHVLEALSDLDLCMLIAAARLDIVAHTDTVNFAMAYDEYTSLVGRQRVQSTTSGLLALGGAARVWGRGVAGMAWERLITLGLLLPAGLGGRATATATATATTSHAGLEARMWKLDVALEEIPVAVKLNAVMSRWCREI